MSRTAAAVLLAGAEGTLRKRFPVHLPLISHERLLMVCPVATMQSPLVTIHWKTVPPPLVLVAFSSKQPQRAGLACWMFVFLFFTHF